MQPPASEVQQPLLATVLYVIQTLTPHILKEAESKQQRQAAARSITATKYPGRGAFLRILERQVETGEPVELMSPLAEQGAQARGLREEKTFWGLCP